MVLVAATKASDDLDTIAALAAKIGKVATPTVNAVETPVSAESLQRTLVLYQDLGNCDSALLFRLLPLFASITIA
uniref:Uncharacterized protein n=1 Tax=Amphimedon queenslandica TaxID=400682 RepID=A0A1X7U4X3_AMPQE